MAAKSSAGGGRKPQPKAGAKRTGAKAPKATAKGSKKKPAPTVILKASDGIGAETVSETPKHAGGRPTKYDPAYCVLAIDSGKLGKSTEWIACEIGVHVDTVYEWAKVHKEFSEAITLAKQLELQWWEDAGQREMTNTGFSASAWSRSMAARFPKKWREKTQVDHGVTDQLAALFGEIDGNSSSLV